MSEMEQRLAMALKDVLTAYTGGMNTTLVYKNSAQALRDAAEEYEQREQVILHAYSLLREHDAQKEG